LEHLQTRISEANPATPTKEKAFPLFKREGFIFSDALKVHFHKQMKK
jgi:hypothetical protein